MIKKLCLTLLVLVLGSYFVAAVTLFNQTDDNQICENVDLAVNDSVRAGFVSSNEIESMLKAQNLYPKGKALKDINTQQIEEALQVNPFISQAICYRSASDRIVIQATQRTPIMRILSETGENFYMDAAGHVMKPSATQYAANMVIVTGNVTASYAVNQLIPLGTLIYNDAFWKNMIEQIHITEKGNVELITRVGDSIVNLGKPDNFQDKLFRLRIFYEKGLSSIGWNKYSKINLEFNNQIVCTRRNNRR